MKKFLIIMVALFVSFAFVTGVMAEKAAKPMKAKGTVTAYDAENKTLTVKVSKKTDLTFNIAPEATVPADLQVGAKVSVTYKKDGDTNVATSIIAKVKKAKKAKKE